MLTQIISDRLAGTNWYWIQPNYHLLSREFKLVISESAGIRIGTELSSYNMKTLMFWACERYPSESWATENLPRTLKQILFTLIEWLIEKHCPNYFIEDCNTLDGISTRWDDYDDHISFLLDIATNRIDALMVNNPIACGSVSSALDLKDIVCLNSFLNLNKFRNHSVHIETVLNQMLMDEIHNLYRAIKCHVKSSQLRNLIYVRDKNWYRICRSSLHFVHDLYVTATKDWGTDIAVNCVFRLTDTLSECCDNWLNSVSIRFPIKFHQNDLQSERNKEHTPEVFTELTRSKLRGMLQMISLILKQFPKLSYVSGCALHANFHHNTKCHDGAFKICTNVLSRFREEYVETYHFFIPVVISSEWSAIYDDHIQAVIGFHILAKRSMKKQ